MGVANVFTIVLFVSLVVAELSGRVLSSLTVSVTDEGAKGDGQTDDTQAFLNAWGEACSDSGDPTFLVPEGMTFLLSTISFNGPCNSTIHVQIDGTVIAPDNISEGMVEHGWINFNNIIGLKINGSGQIDGKGSAWWACRAAKQCTIAPMGLYVANCKDVQLSGLSIQDSPMMHVFIKKSVGVQISGLNITAPANSPNTDGIHIQQSQHVEVMNSVIGTGDDCISIATGSSDVNIWGISCGPGHGISIGSLGSNNSEAQVEQIHVSQCNLYGTSNGLRIKTWQGGSGFARGILFENINFTSVQRPIIIDQYYCEHGTNCPNKTSAVHVSDVQYSRAVGTSAGDEAIILRCSTNVACTNITMDYVNIQSPNSTAKSFCFNAYGTQKDVNPPIPCLTEI